MAMDGLNLAASVAECRRIVGGRIDKIQQPEKDELAVNLRCGGENLRLLISASPEHCRMQLTNVKKENPIDAPAFCMLLRKRLAGGRVVYVEQPNLDRIVNIGIEAQNAPLVSAKEGLGRSTKCRLHSIRPPNQRPLPKILRQS